MIMASSYMSAFSIGCAGACGEDGCGRGSLKNREALYAPFPPEPSDKPDLSCGNAGLEYAIFPRPDGDFEPIKQTAPEATGVTTTVGFAVTTNIYGSVPANSQHLWVNHRGYLYAGQSGDYTFSMTLVDNDAMLWFGKKAYSGYTQQNVDVFQGWIAAGTPAVESKQTLQKGNYYPIRLLFANWGGPGNLKLTVKAPDGSLILDDQSGSSEYFVRFSCDGILAPKYPAFGAEPVGVE